MVMMIMKSDHSMKAKPLCPKCWWDI